jgi:hypothetical protein
MHTSFPLVHSIQPTNLPYSLPSLRPLACNSNFFCLDQSSPSLSPLAPLHLDFFLCAHSRSILFVSKGLRVNSRFSRKAKGEIFKGQSNKQQASKRAAPAHTFPCLSLFNAGCLLHFPRTPKGNSTMPVYLTPLDTTLSGDTLTRYPQFLGGRSCLRVI